MPIFDETVVVDTGSVDKSREVARSFGATVVEFPWCDDFSAARNMALTQCACDSVFWMDADELLSRPSRERLARLLRHGVDQDTVYLMDQVSNRLDGSLGFIEAPSPRLFANRRGIRWSGRVYERIVPSLRAAGLKFIAVNISMTHGGFAQASSAVGKLSRNKRLLEIELADDAGDPRVLLNLALTHSLIGRFTAHPDEFKAAQLDLERRALLDEIRHLREGSPE